MRSYVFKYDVVSPLKWLEDHGEKLNEEGIKVVDIRRASETIDGIVRQMKMPPNNLQ